MSEDGRSSPRAADILAAALMHARARRSSMPPPRSVPPPARGPSSVPPARPSNAPPPPARTAKRWPAPVGPARTKILLVCQDDGPTEAILRELGSVLIAGDAPTALAICEEEVPEVVIADAAAIAGFDLLRQLQRPARVPVLVYGASTPSEVVAAINAGARHVLEKPVDRRILEARIKGALR